jgi:hypothetical protein
LPFGGIEIVAHDSGRQILTSRAIMTLRLPSTKMQLSGANPAFFPPIAAEIPYRAG